MASYLPATYQPGWNYGVSGVGQQVYQPYQGYQQGMSMAQPQTGGAVQGQNGPGLIWVDGEVGAKAYQMPQGWPSNQPIALWDTNDTVIYLKSTNPMGMPNPLQKAHYTLEERKAAYPQRSGDAEPVVSIDTTEFVRKDELEDMKKELMDAISSVKVPADAGNVRKGTKGE